MSGDSAARENLAVKPLRNTSASIAAGIDSAHSSLRRRTVSGGGRTPNRLRRERSGRPERPGLLEGRSPGREEPRASAARGEHGGEKPVRDGFRKGRTRP
jgi:hypothetical protein